MAPPSLSVSRVSLLAGLLLLVVAPRIGEATWTPIGPDGGTVRRGIVDPTTPTTLHAAP